MLGRQVVHQQQRRLDLLCLQKGLELLACDLQCPLGVHPGVLLPMHDDAGVHGLVAELLELAEGSRARLAPEDKNGWELVTLSADG